MDLFYNMIRLHCDSLTRNTVTDVCYVATVCLFEGFTGLCLDCVFLASVDREVSVYFMFNSTEGLGNIPLISSAKVFNPLLRDSICVLTQTHNAQG